MTVGDDGIASICMGKAHTGDPCERCGHTSEEPQIIGFADDADMRLPEEIWIESVHLAKSSARKYGTYYFSGDNTSIKYIKTDKFNDAMFIVQRAAGELCHRIDYEWAGTCATDGGPDGHYMCAACLAKKFIKENK